jgi:CHASE2 domain-containing sensor protein
MDKNWVIKRMPAWERRHPRFWAGVHFIGGVWLLVITALLYGYHRAGWWTPLLAPAAAGHFYAAYCLQRLADERRSPWAAA